MSDNTVLVVDDEAPGAGKAKRFSRSRSVAGLREPVSLLLYGTIKKTKISAVARWRRSAGAASAD